jgi:hypothetical protein
VLLTDLDTSNYRTNLKKDGSESDKCVKAMGKRSVTNGRLNGRARLDEGSRLPIETWIYRLGNGRS